MAFERFDRREAKYAKRPQLTVQTQGAISINAAAHRLLGDPSHIELFFDPEERIIGMAAAPADTPFGYPIRPQGEKGSTFVTSARAFLLKYGIPFDKSRRYEAELMENLLIARLGPITAESEEVEIST